MASDHSLQRVSCILKKWQGFVRVRAHRLLSEGIKKEAQRLNFISLPVPVLIARSQRGATARISGICNRTIDSDACLLIVSE